jgi:hypothetical protein
LSGSTIGEKENFVWKEPGVDLPQQFTSVLGPWVTCAYQKLRSR